MVGTTHHSICQRLDRGMLLQQSCHHACHQCVTCTMQQPAQQYKLYHLAVMVKGGREGIRVHDQSSQPKLQHRGMHVMHGCALANMMALFGQLLLSLAGSAGRGQGKPGVQQRPTPAAEPPPAHLPRSRWPPPPAAPSAAPPPPPAAAAARVPPLPTPTPTPPQPRPVRRSRCCCCCLAAAATPPPPVNCRPGPPPRRRRLAGWQC